MEVFAYCCQSFTEAARKAAGVTPKTSPPITGETFDPAWVKDKDFIYFDLHGQPGETKWYGDGGIVALEAEHLQQCELGGAVVFAINCYLGDEDSPMLDALLDAGARYVIGGDGPNYAGQWALFGAGMLARSVRRWMRVGISPLDALKLGKEHLEVVIFRDRMLKTRQDRIMAARDALDFKAYYRR